ncbi:MAG: pyridoxal 5'-phosphate synthase glutaminase subunit PdxT, partial [Desulfovibrio sp.]|nr:pyridoxal 5'-phosphate synthase glutaminase subunit PdxT [Desulfovibrio sp.]
MQVAVLALQGAFIEHEHALSDIGVESFEIREAGDLKRDFDGLVLPGGESTVQGKLLKDLGLFSSLKERIEEGMPVLATCAGLILLAERLESDST